MKSYPQPGGGEVNNQTEACGNRRMIKPQVIPRSAIPALMSTTRQDSPFAVLSRRLGAINVPSEKWSRDTFLHRARLSEVIRNSANDSYLAGASACLLRGLPTARTTRDIDVIIRSAHSRPATRIGAFTPDVPESTVKRRRRNYPDSAFTTINGLPTLSDEFFILDCLSMPDPVDAFVPVDALVYRKCSTNLYNRMATEEAMERLQACLLQIVESGNYPYTKRRVRRRINFLSPWCQSPGETHLRIACLVAGTPQFVQQYQITTPSGLRFLDFAWPEHSVAIEYDGEVKYVAGEGRTLFEEKLREDWIRQHFATVKRITKHDLRDVYLHVHLRSLFPPHALTHAREV